LSGGKMQTRDLLLLAYEALHGEIRGKTNVQKKMYFLGVMLGMDLGYDPHYYGPYSPEVADANANLKSMGYLTESTASAGTYNSRGFEIARHDFNLTDEGSIAAAEKKRLMPQEWQEVQNAVTRLEAAGDPGYMELSIAAKSYYVLTQKGGRATFDDIRATASKLGWSVSEDDIQRAVGFLERLSLVRRTARAN
jgi:uncharacterized protein